MESCFPPLASLSLRGSSNSASSSPSPAAVSAQTNNKHQKNRHSLGSSSISGGSGTDMANHARVGSDGSNSHNSDYLPKLEVIQDLDLYYIRQIACSLKVSIEGVGEWVLKRRKWKKGKMWQEVVIWWEKISPAFCSFLSTHSISDHVICVIPSFFWVALILNSISATQ